MSYTTPDAKSSGFQHGSAAKSDPEIRVDNRNESLDKSFENQIKELSKEVLRLTSDPNVTEEDLEEKMDNIEYKIAILERMRKLELFSDTRDNSDKREKTEKTNDNQTNIVRSKIQFKPGVAEVLKDNLSNITGGNILLSQKDEIGQFYQFKNLKNDTIKYYYDNSNSRFEHSLKKVEDIAMWCKALSNYPAQWNFDNITIMNNPEIIDKNEDMIITKIIKGSVSDDFGN